MNKYLFQTPVEVKLLKSILKTENEEPLGILEQIRQREANKPPVKIEEELQRMNEKSRKPKNIILYGGIEFMKKLKTILPKKYFK